MTKKSLFVEARKKFLNDQSTAKTYQQEIEQKKSEIQKLENEVHRLRTIRNSFIASNNHLEIFSKKVSWPIFVSYRYCTNYSDIATDLYGRGRDYQHEEKNIELSVEKVELYFSANEKKFYDKKNFRIKLYTSNQLFSVLVCNCNVEVLEVYPSGHCSDRFRFNPSIIVNDVDFKSLIKIMK